MNPGLIAIIVLLIILVVVIMASLRAYSSIHAKLEAEREEHDKFERLFKFMGKWMEAEENGKLLATKIQALGQAIVILGDNPIAHVLCGKLDKAGIAYRVETQEEGCTGDGLVLVADISHYEKWKNKLDKIGVKSMSIEDIFYDEVD